MIICSEVSLCGITEDSLCDLWWVEGICVTSNSLLVVSSSEGNGVVALKGIVKRRILDGEESLCGIMEDSWVQLCDLWWVITLDYCGNVLLVVVC